MDRVDPAAARQLRWKIDLHVCPILSVVYALSFLDRINISNARSQGLTEEPELHENRYNTALFLVALCFLLGVFEAGVMPGIIYPTSMYYRRHELQTRMSSSLYSVVVAGALGGLLAYVIAGLDRHHNIRAWRWIFIIEGSATTFIAVITAFLIVDWPSQCRFLNIEEKALLSRILAADGADEARSK
ncbi:major facilitator superfamily domain-containing protein [Nemania abortiva]|nr:major facilitator superfamily domain-containing protein [Nemania abortiva]